MTARSSERQRRAVDGVLLLDKPPGITSQAAVTRAKSLLGAVKAGHTGTLDPMATGLLPLAFGEATKFSHVLLGADKSYSATVQLGMTTTTGDLEGAVLTRAEVDVDPAAIAAALARFRGEIAQTPPMYSALKHGGKPLYEYARAGLDVARAARTIAIHTLEIESWEGALLRVHVDCSKGTYIRVLAEDIGKALGCGATLAALRRLRVGPFSVDDAVTLDAFQAMTDAERVRRVLRVDALLASLPSLDLDAQQAHALTRGQSVDFPGASSPGLMRIYGPDAGFLGVAEASADGRLTPRRLVASAR